MHSRRSVLKVVVVAGAVAFAAPSLAEAQDQPATGQTPASGETVGTVTATSKDAAKKKKDAKKKKKKGSKDEEEDAVPPAQVTTTIDPGTPTDENGNPSIV